MAAARTTLGHELIELRFVLSHSQASEKLLKLVVILTVWLIAELVLTFAWAHRLASKAPPNRAIDVTCVVLSPIFLLGFAVILAVAARAYWRWALR